MVSTFSWAVTNCNTLDFLDLDSEGAVLACAQSHMELYKVDLAM